MFKNKQGISLIELLVILGIIATLVAISIPIISGIVNKSKINADEANINELNKAIEQFVSEYEIYHNDILEGKIDTDNLNATQSRIFNTVNIKTEIGVELLESDGYEGKKLNKNTKYPLNYQTIKAVINNYVKSPTETLTPNQSNMHYWYSPDCGVVICDEPTSTTAELNANIKTNLDGSGNRLTDNTVWINITNSNYVKFDVKYKSGFLPKDNGTFIKVILEFHRDGSGIFTAELYDANKTLIDSVDQNSILGTYKYKEGEITSDGEKTAIVLENGEALEQKGTVYGDVILYLND